MRKKALKKNATAFITLAVPPKPERVTPCSLQTKRHRPSKTAGIPDCMPSCSPLSAYKRSNALTPPTRKKIPNKKPTVSLYPVDRACKKAILSRIEISSKNRFGGF